MALNPVDAKGRLSVPAEYRQVILYRERVAGRRAALAAGLGEDAEEPAAQLTLGRDTKYGCLRVSNPSFIGELEARIHERHADKRGEEREDAITADTAIFATYQSFGWDSTGRIMLPQRLRDRVGIKTEAFFQGRGADLWVWDPDVFIERHPEREIEIDFILDERARRGGKA